MSKKVTKGQGWSLVTVDTNVAKEVESLPSNEQKVNVSLEKRKKGKIVTVVSGIVLSQNDLKALCKKLKVSCGTGGTFTKDTVELQGDCCEKAKVWLTKNNWNIHA